MKKFYEVNQYIQWIEIENKKVIKFSCTCPDFVYRRLKKDGEKVKATECKHLRRIKLWNKI